MEYLALPGAIVALLTIGIILFKGFKAVARGIVAVDSLIKSIEANTAAQTGLVKAQVKIAHTVERFRKATKAEIDGVKGQIEDLDSRLDSYEQILSPLDIKKAG